MQLIPASVELLKEKDPLRLIELAGRTCYKSEANITKESANQFVRNLIKNGHTAMLEHGTIELNLRSFLDLPFFKTKITPTGYLISGNCRAWVEHFSMLNNATRYVLSNRYPTLFEHLVTCDTEVNLPTEELKIPRYTIKFITNRGIGYELIRHRTMPMVELNEGYSSFNNLSYAQESTRYCNYGKDHFNNGLTFIDDSRRFAVSNRVLLEQIEQTYLKAISEGIPAQTARDILPNCLKTEIIVTGYKDQWSHFFGLRCAPQAHPDMRFIAEQAQLLISQEEKSE